MSHECQLCCAETLAWRAVKAGRGSPPPAADASLTCCGEHGVVFFGGHTGTTSASSAVHVLHPGTGTWETLDVEGCPPPPRGQHTAVWDGDDSLIVFGGTAAGGAALVAGEVQVLSLSQRRWWQPEVKAASWGDSGGESGPGPRAHHCAAMLSTGRTMALFGGVSSQVSTLC